MWGCLKSFRFWISRRIFPTTSKLRIFCRFRIFTATWCLVSSCWPTAGRSDGSINNTKQNKVTKSEQTKLWTVIFRFYTLMSAACGGQWTTTMFINMSLSACQVKSPKFTFLLAFFHSSTTNPEGNISMPCGERGPSAWLLAQIRCQIHSEPIKAHIKAHLAVTFQTRASKRLHIHPKQRWGQGKSMQTKQSHVWTRLNPIFRNTSLNKDVLCGKQYRFHLGGIKQQRRALSAQMVKYWICSTQKGTSSNELRLFSLQQQIARVQEADESLENECKHSQWFKGELALAQNHVSTRQNI